MTLLRGLKKCLIVHIHQGGNNGIFQSWTYYVHDWMPWDQLHSPLVCSSASRWFALLNHDAWGKFNLNHKFPNHVKLLCIQCKNLIQSFYRCLQKLLLFDLIFVTQDQNNRLSNGSVKQLTILITLFQTKRPMFILNFERKRLERHTIRATYSYLHGKSIITK